jgi:hypothetical protein
VAVAIVSYQRPRPLLACLKALAGQERAPDDVIVVIRADDAATREALATRPDDGLPMHVIAVDVVGVVAARNAALAGCRSDIIAGATIATTASGSTTANPTLSAASCGMGGRSGTITSATVPRARCISSRAPT